MPSDMIAIGMSWLADQIAEHASQEVICTRDGDVETTAYFTIGETMFRLDDGQGGTQIVWSDLDFLGKTVDLPFGTPEEGDRFEFNGETYEALPYGGEPVSRHEDGHGYITRIHTKKIS